MNNESEPENEASGTLPKLSDQDQPSSGSLVTRVDNVALAQLNSRIVLLSNSLEESLQDLTKIHALNLQEERDTGLLNDELDNWTTLMTELESIVDWLFARDKHNRPTVDGHELPTNNIGENTFRSEQDILESFTMREDRIRELEAQLQNLNTQEIPSVKPETPYVNRIILTSNGLENFKFPLTRSIMTIGREARNDIHVPSRFISRFHARIISDAEGSIIEDLESSNGIKVNSQQVHRKQLRSGDLVDLGRTQLKFIDLMEGSSSEGSA